MAAIADTLTASVFG